MELSCLELLSGLAGTTEVESLGGVSITATAGLGVATDGDCVDVDSTAFVPFGWPFRADGEADRCCLSSGSALFRWRLDECASLSDCSLSWSNDESCLFRLWEFESCVVEDADGGFEGAGFCGELALPSPVSCSS
jgi:hypothetical protein